MSEVSAKRKAALWVGAVLAALLSLDRLFQGDYEDGSLDVIALSPLSLEMVALAKIKPYTKASRERRSAA